MATGKRTFASDNYAGVHPEVMEALIRANANHAGSYGADPYTERAVRLFKQFFGEDAEVFLVYNGTAANTLGLSAITKSYNSIICSSLAHINVDESTAPEKFTGCKLITIDSPDCKLLPEQIEARIQRVGDQHHPQVKVISISQSSEYGTVYTADEVRALSAVAKKHNLYLHMDGSRISNAAVSLNAEFRSFTRDAGVDVLSFGGTKNGMMFGEAVVFFNPDLAKDFSYIRKQGMQLHSKMRFIGAQFEALLSNDLWKRNATHANKMARKLAEVIKQNGGTITQRVDANGVFAMLPVNTIAPLQEERFFYIWNDVTNEVRLMCSFETSEEDVEAFGKRMGELKN
ncbi:low specificity L-threonine aldolase [Chryseolinea sp. T2]|uniref:threonine aldolase family protein n=1 Tax=Chryseolinea sp. T2 TaxID=3129255 RepID=UPI0030772919